MNSTSVERAYLLFKDHFQRELEATRDLRTRQALRHCIRRCAAVVEAERARAAARQGVPS